MISSFLKSEAKYDGTQLVSLHNYLQHRLLGDSIVGWIGGCDISAAHMVDGEDLLENATIAGDRMLHFIVEMFDSTLFAAVGMQRLLASLVLEQLRTDSPRQELAQSLVRRGDDIFAGTRKLSISIATQSPVSSLIHFAVNVSNAGTPVSTLSLEDLGVAPERLALALMEAFCKEVQSIREATRKVRWVK